MKQILLFILLGISTNSWAQDIKGRVVEEVDGKKVGIPGANVFWAGTTEGQVTDEKGN